VGLRRYGFWKEVQNIRLYRNPDPSKGRWTRLVLPADYASGKLAGWNQKHAKDQSSTQFGCNPWGRSDFLAGDAFLYGVGYIEVLDPQATLHPIGDYSSEGSFLWDGWVKGSLCGWSHDKQNQRFGFEFILDNEAEEHQPLVVYDDGAGWVLEGYGSGSANISGGVDSEHRVRGESCFRFELSTSGGTYLEFYPKYTFPSAVDVSGYDFLCVWWYGAGSGKTNHFILYTSSGWLRWGVVDGWVGWRRLILPLRAPHSVGGTPNLSSATAFGLAFYYAQITDRVHYIDRTLFDFARLVRCEVRVPDAVKSVDLYSWDGSSYQKFLENGLPSSNKLFFLSGLKMSDFRRDGSGLGSTYLGSRGEQVKYRNALSFDGVDDYVSVSDSSNLRGFSNLTILMWVKIPSGTGYWGFASKTDRSNGWQFIKDWSTQRTLFEIFEGGSNSGSTTTSYSNIPGNTWTQIGIVVEGLTWKFIINGAVDKVFTSSRALIHSTVPLWIGRSRASNPYLNGLIGEARIYSRALSASEIQQLYLRRFDDTIPDVRSGLVLDLPLDGDALDYSGFGNHGTVYGAKWVAPTSTQLSGKHGCRKRIVFVIGMPPEDYRDSASGGVSQAKIKLEVKYASEGEATYEFEDSDNQYYGLRNISKPYILLFRRDNQGPVDFIQLKNTSVGDGLPTYLAVKADHSEEIREVQITLPSLTDQSRKHWGQSTSDPTQDQDGDGILDVVEEVEGFVDQGGWG
jgi:hypothetical protein